MTTRNWLPAALLTLAVAGTTGTISRLDAADTPATPKNFSFAKLNRAYKDLVSDFAPIQQGPITLTLSSPTQTVVLKGNRATLTARPDGTYDARVALDVTGTGWITGDVDFAGQGTRLQDELVLPAQTVALDGRVKVQRAATGYSITTLSLPAELVVTVNSGIAARFVTWCDRLSLVPLTNLPCEDFERSMNEVRVPLPPAGETYVLPFEELEAADRKALDAYFGFP